MGQARAKAELYAGGIARQCVGAIGAAGLPVAGVTASRPARAPDMLLELAGKQDRKNKGYAFHRKHFGDFFLFSAQPDSTVPPTVTDSARVRTRSPRSRSHPPYSLHVNACILEARDRR